MAKFSDFSLEDRKLLQAAYDSGLRVALLNEESFPSVLGTILNKDCVETNFVKITIDEIEGFKSL